MRYDILEYFSIYGTALSIWVSLMGKNWSVVAPESSSTGSKAWICQHGWWDSQWGQSPEMLLALSPTRAATEIVLCGSQSVLWINPVLYH